MSPLLSSIPCVQQRSWHMELEVKVISSSGQFIYLSKTPIFQDTRGLLVCLNTQHEVLHGFCDHAGLNECPWKF